MSFRSLAFLLLVPATALGFDFTASPSAGGGTWRFDIPAGWHVIDSPAALAEGGSVRLGSAASITSTHPLPTTGTAMIVLGFYPGPLDRPEPEAQENMAKLQRMASDDLGGGVVVDHRTAIVDGHLIAIAIATYNHDLDIETALAQLTASIRRMTP